MMTQQNKAQVSSRIIELELEMTLSVINGHRPLENDKFKDKRQELVLLRCLYFGYQTKFCNTKKNSWG